MTDEEWEAEMNTFQGPPPRYGGNFVEGPGFVAHTGTRAKSVIEQVLEAKRKFTVTWGFGPRKVVIGDPEYGELVREVRDLMGRPDLGMVNTLAGLEVKFSLTRLGVEVSV